MDTSNLEKQRAHFEKVAQKYFSARQSPRFKAVQSTIWDHFFSLIPLPNKEEYPLKILEAMCGYAESYPLAKKYLGNNISLCGFDYSEAMVSLAHERYPKINIWQQDITTFEQNTSYDVVFLIGGAASCVQVPA